MADGEGMLLPGSSPPTAAKSQPEHSSGDVNAQRALLGQVAEREKNERDELLTALARLQSPSGRALPSCVKRLLPDPLVSFEQLHRFRLRDIDHLTRVQVHHESAQLRYVIAQLEVDDVPEWTWARLAALTARLRAAA